MTESFNAILVVEDEIFASKYLLEILRSLGFKDISEATNAKDALKIVQSKKIDLVFMDINIQGPKDGMQCAQILNKEYFIPVVYSTAYGDQETLDEAMQSNAYGYLIKPFEQEDVQAVLSIVKRLLVSHAQLENKEEKTSLDEDLSLGDRLTYNFEHKTLQRANKSIVLTAKELDVLDLFCKNKNQNISYELLKSGAWDDTNISNSTVRDTVSRLKKKVPELPIKNIMNYGYVLN